MKREERYEFTYINSMGKEKTEQTNSKARLNNCLQTCKDLGYKVIGTRKLYPFSTIRNQHNFELIANICFNTMYDMEHGDIEWDDKEYERLAETRNKAEQFFVMPLPVAWVPYETYREMKEISVAAICHRDAANARARQAREEADERDSEEADERDSDWRPGDAPWNAPGMSTSDFIR